MNIIETLMTIIAPHACLGCMREGSLLCPSCATGLPSSIANCCYCGTTTKGSRLCKQCRLSSELDACIRVTAYEGVAKQLLQGLKFDRQKAAARPIGQSIAARIAESTLMTSDTVVTYIPTATGRVRARGYDQAHIIAQAAAHALSLPCRSLLARTGQQRQLGQTRAERMRQLDSAFRTLPQDTAFPEHILLIDDVFTTGSSMEAAARALRGAGARHITAAAFAEALRD